MTNYQTLLNILTDANREIDNLVREAYKNSNINQQKEFYKIADALKDQSKLILKMEEKQLSHQKSPFGFIFDQVVKK